jgi:hypothetical protein
MGVGQGAAGLTGRDREPPLKIANYAGAVSISKNVGLES